MSSFKSADDLYKRLLEKYTTELNSGDTIQKKQAYRKELQEIGKSMREEDLKDLYSIHLDRFSAFLDDKSLDIIEDYTSVVTRTFLDIVKFMTIGEMDVVSIKFPEKEFSKIGSYLDYKFAKNEPFDPFSAKGQFAFYESYFTEIYIKTFRYAAIRRSLSDFSEIDSMFTSVAEKDKISDKHYTVSEMKDWVDEMWKEVRPKHDSANKAKIEAYERMKKKFGKDARKPDTIVAWACKYKK